MKKIVAEYLGRGTHWVVALGAIAKLLSIFVTLYALNHLSPKEFGQITLILMFLSPTIPLAGIALDYSFLRFGAISKPEDSLEPLKSFCLRLGVLTSFAFVIVFNLVFLLTDSLRNIPYHYVSTLSLLLLLEFLFRMLENTFRIEKNNRGLAFLNLARVCFTIFLCIALIPIFGPWGYALSLILSPASLLLIVGARRLLASSKHAAIRENRSDLIKYGLYIGFGAVCSQFHLPLGGIILNNITQDIELVAVYKVAIIFPTALFLLVNLFFKSEFVHIANLSNIEIKKYLGKYFILSSLICLFTYVAVFVFFKSLILALVGDEYVLSLEIMKPIFIGFSLGIVFRQSIGNVLSAKGLATANVKNAVLLIVISFISYYYFISKDGIHGLGTALIVSMLLSIVIMGGTLLYYYKRDFKR